MRKIPFERQAAFVEEDGDTTTVLAGNLDTNKRVLVTLPPPGDRGAEAASMVVTDSTNGSVINYLMSPQDDEVVRKVGATALAMLITTALGNKTETGIETGTVTLPVSAITKLTEAVLSSQGIEFRPLDVESPNHES